MHQDLMTQSNARVKLRTSQIEARAKHAQSLNRSAASTIVRPRAAYADDVRARTHKSLPGRRHVPVAKHVNAAVQIEPNPPFQRTLFEHGQIDIRTSRADPLEGQRLE